MASDNNDFNEFSSALGLYVEDPWERVKFIFMKNDHGDLHPDAQNALTTTQIGIMLGVAIGGTLRQQAYLAELKERSDANVYYNQKDAYKHMTQKSWTGFVQGALKWGPRVGLFAGCFSLFASCVEAYRNKSGIIEYSIGGSVIGGLLRGNFGVRGILVGSALGSVLGTVYGVTHLGICKLTHTDSAEIKYGQYALSKYLAEKSAKKTMEKEKKQIGILSSSDLYVNPLDSLTDDEQPGSDKTKKTI